MHEDLFSQAYALAKLDALKPKQANLRRAVSSAYYGVFHYLVHEACCVQIGTQHAQAPYRNALGRGFAHAIMKDACTSFGGGTLKDAGTKGLPRDADNPTTRSSFSHVCGHGKNWPNVELRHSQQTGAPCFFISEGAATWQSRWPSALQVQLNPEVKMGGGAEYFANPPKVGTNCP